MYARASKISLLEKAKNVYHTKPHSTETLQLIKERFYQNYRYSPNSRDEEFVSEVLSSLKTCEDTFQVTEFILQKKLPELTQGEIYTVAEICIEQYIKKYQNSDYSCIIDGEVGLDLAFCDYLRYFSRLHPKGTEKCIAYKILSNCVQNCNRKVLMVSPIGLYQILLDEVEKNFCCLG
jgi:hypothetical protein